MRLFKDANYNFVSKRKIGYVLSGLLLTISIISFATRGFELGVDFEGGTEIVLENVEEVSAVELRTELTEPLGAEPQVRTFGDTGLIVRTAAEGETADIQQTIIATIQAVYPDTEPTIEMTEVVGPSFAADLQRGALYSILGALFVVFVYILVRFEWRFSLGALAALVHDVTITLGIFSLFAGIAPFSLQLDQAIVAAFLTIVGYSLNDTVVVFDRIREFENLFKTEEYNNIVDRGINATLSRTIVTSVTTLIVVTVLFILGGEVLRSFSFALIFGVCIGTYSSIFVASQTVVELRHYAQRQAA